MTRFLLIVPSATEDDAVGVEVFGDSPDGASRTCSTPCSATGSGPATHWAGSGVMDEGERAAFVPCASALPGARWWVLDDLAGTLLATNVASSNARIGTVVPVWTLALDAGVRPILGE